MDVFESNEVIQQFQTNLNDLEDLNCEIQELIKYSDGELYRLKSAIKRVKEEKARKQTENVERKKELAMLNSSLDQELKDLNLKKTQLAKLLNEQGKEQAGKVDNKYFECVKELDGLSEELSCNQCLLELYKVLSNPDTK